MGSFQVTIQESKVKEVKCFWNFRIIGHKERYRVLSTKIIMLNFELNFNLYLICFSEVNYFVVWK